MAAFGWGAKHHEGRHQFVGQVRSDLLGGGTQQWFDDIPVAAAPHGRRLVTSLETSEHNVVGRPGRHPGILVDAGVEVQRGGVGALPVEDRQGPFHIGAGGKGGEHHTVSAFAGQRQHLRAFGRQPHRRLGGRWVLELGGADSVELVGPADLRPGQKAPEDGEPVTGRGDHRGRHPLGCIQGPWATEPEADLETWAEHPMEGGDLHGQGGRMANIE